MYLACALHVSMWGGQFLASSLLLSLYSPVFLCTSRWRRYAVLSCQEGNLYAGRHRCPSCVCFGVPGKRCCSSAEFCCSFFKSVPHHSWYDPPRRHGHEWQWNILVSWETSRLQYPTAKWCEFCQLGANRQGGLCNGMGLLVSVFRVGPDPIGELQNWVLLLLGQGCLMGRLTGMWVASVLGQFGWYWLLYSGEPYAAGWLFIICYSVIFMIWLVTAHAQLLLFCSF